jgi:hypothetical protein
MKKCSFRTPFDQINLSYRSVHALKNRCNPRTQISANVPTNFDLQNYGHAYIEAPPRQVSYVNVMYDDTTAFKSHFFSDSTPYVLLNMDFLHSIHFHYYEY